MNFEVKNQPGRNLALVDRSRLAFRLTRKWIEDYLLHLEQSDCAAATLQGYRRNLERLYDFLPRDKYIREGTLAAWQDSLQEAGYSVSMINTCTAAANGLMRYSGHIELQAERLTEIEENIQPELTRAEYIRLLSAARMLGKKRTYLLVKVFGSTGLTVSDLESLTAEAVIAGKITLPSAVFRIPGGLRDELEEFIREENITSGPIFLTRNGTPQGRTVVTNMIKSLCRDAQVAVEKANPRCLRKLYLSTQAGIAENLALLAEQMYDRMLEKEDQTIGWKLET